MVKLTICLFSIVVSVDIGIVINRMVKVSDSEVLIETCDSPVMKCSQL